MLPVCFSPIIMLSGGQAGFHLLLNLSIFGFQTVFIFSFLSAFLAFIPAIYCWRSLAPPIFSFPLGRRHNSVPGSFLLHKFLCWRYQRRCSLDFLACSLLSQLHSVFRNASNTFEDMDKSSILPIISSERCSEVKGRAGW